MIKKLIVVCGILILALPQFSSATPSYAKDLNLACTTCHTVFPQLNAYGKQFKENLGSQLPQDQHGALSLSEYPLSARFNFRFVDTEDNQLHLRAFHESELFLTGRTGKVFYFGEIEGEDESLNDMGFTIGISKAYLAYDYRPELKFFGGLTEPFVLDANNTLAHEKVIRYEWSASGEGFLPGVAQTVGIEGKTANKISYILAFHGDDSGPGWAEGKSASSFSGRLTYDVGVHTVGGYFTNGFRYVNEDSTKENQYQLYGVDGRFSFGNINALVLFGVKDNKDVNLTDNNLSIEFNMRMNKLTPVLGIDSYTDGDDSWTKYGFGLLFDIGPNIRITPAIEGILSAPSGTSKDTRFTLTGDIGI